MKSKIKIGKAYSFKILDHSEDDNVSNLAIKPEHCILDMYGEVVGVDNLYIRAKIINASIDNNSMYWNIIRSTILEMEEIEKKPT